MTGSGSFSGTVDDAKRVLAERARIARRAIHRKAAAAAARAVSDCFLHRLETGFATGPGGIIAGYWPLPDELDVRPLLAALHGLGRAVALPVTATAAGPLSFRRWRVGDELVPAAHGISEPGTGAPTVTPALVITPLLAVDSAGYRLGYGAGYYDRTLSLLRRAGPVEAVGVGFAAQLVDHVPHDTADERLDWVITEHGAIRVGR